MRLQVIIFFFLYIFLTSCQVAHYERTANVDWIENGTETYPSYQTTRTRKDIVLPLSLRTGIEQYYRKYHFWPMSTEGFLNDSPQYRSTIQQLARQGFIRLDLISYHPDTLAVEFSFERKAKLYYNTDAGISLSPTDLGRFLFIHRPNGIIYYNRVIDKRKKRS